MATITNWIKHIEIDTVPTATLEDGTIDTATEGVQQASAIYPMVGTEGVLVIILLVIWIGWHVITSASEDKELAQASRKRHGANDHKSNITEW